METLKKQRTILRRMYTESEKKLRRAIDEVSPNLSQLYLLCKEKAANLSTIDDKIKDEWFLEESASEDDIYTDLQSNEIYRLSWLEISSEFEKTQNKLAPASVCLNCEDGSLVRVPLIISPYQCWVLYGIVTAIPCASHRSKTV
ncbi:hypothetical protein ACJJTC_006960 [Scirpophaga incertulas]